MAKILFYSLAIMALLILINVAPVILDNIGAKRVALLGVLPQIIKSLKLWGLFVSVMIIVSSLTFWSAVGKGGSK